MKHIVDTLLNIIFSKKRKGESVGGRKKKIKTTPNWTPEEDQLLREAISINEGKNWRKIAEYLKEHNKNHTQCLHRWQKVLNPKLVKGAWTKEVYVYISCN